MAIFHVATRAEWEAADAVGSYQMSTKGATLDQVGFIHASWWCWNPTTTEFVARAS